MRILRIALQNINSLQSDQPILIDLTSESFKDIGVFAITGPTGAGKSSILDAIMIALYHQVPRLGSGGERELEKCISYGSTEAQVTIDFEIKNHVYQAYWGVSTVTKTGKAKKPDHKFRISKLLQAGKVEVLADRTKTEVELVLREILPLNANQFMKSVLLAQGQFDALLKANNTDRAQLLRQITGDDVYERISEEVHNRKSEEINRENILRNSINNKFVLEPEEVILTKQGIEEQQKLRNEIQIENTAITKANEFFKLEQRIDGLKEQIKTQKIQTEEFYLGHQGDFDRLSLNDKLEQYRGKVDQYFNTKKRLVEIGKNIKETEAVLGQKNNDLTTQKDLVNRVELNKQNAEKEDLKWRPILEQVQLLDEQIKGVEEISLEWIKEQKNLSKNSDTISKEKALKKQD